MNLDLLKKLTRLANNNPNDNEANLAARKVCKMLEAGNWLLPAAPVVKTAAEKVKQAATWNDVKRSTEPEFKSKPQASKNQYQEDFFKKFYENLSEDEKRRWRTYREGSWNVRFDPADYPFTSSKKKSSAYSERPKRMLRCTKCGVDKETGYVGNLYVCTDCYWKDYNQKQEAK